ncbi:hypothetical protein QQF64_034587 [Cirrhinus molitorella]|uniref:Uncharacterized protein n=1 Tax=Cirrhinus molitorella TaxID=172907 RepID=A0ABR3L0Y7_9TELE
MTIVNQFLSVEQCWSVLQSAENDVLKHIVNLMMDWRYIREMTREQELLLVYFLEALVMLCFLQEPEVVKKMTWFDVYYSYLRSVMIERRHKRCSSDEAEKFFMYSSGNPVDNPSEDLKKLHDEYHLPSVSTDMVRSSVHTAVYKLHLTDDEKLSSILTEVVFFSPADAPEPNG